MIGFSVKDKMYGYLPEVLVESDSHKIRISRFRQIISLKNENPTVLL